jgi:hypothetical protein
MGNFDVTTPAGSDLLSQGDDKIREFKLAVRESLRAGALAGDDIEGVEAIFPGSSPSTAPVYRYRGLKDTTANRPAAGQYGLFFDMTRNVLQRDNGTSWDDIGASIPSGTKMVFYQASAPVGWTAVALNDKFLRVVTSGGTGGSTGGTIAASTSLSHSHTVNSHTHDLGNHTHTTPAHTHPLKIGTTPVLVDSSVSGIPPTYTESSGDIIGVQGGSGAVYAYTVYSITTSSGNSTSGTPSSNTSGSTAPGTDSMLGAFAYADVIVASKD